MTGLAERLRSEGMQQGMQQGEQTLLRKQLVRRFGPLDEETEQRLQQATTDELERWAENLLDTESLAEVFGGGEGGQPPGLFRYKRLSGVEATSLALLANARKLGCSGLSR